MRWETVHPVLIAVYRLLDEQDVVSGMEIVATFAQDSDLAHVPRALQHLHRHHYLSAEFELGSSLPVAVSPTEKGLQLMSGWPGLSPSQSFGRFLTELEDRIEAAPNEADRSRLVRLRDAFLAVGRDVGTEIVSKIAARQVGLE